jgi:hypothetical protein
MNGNYFSEGQLIYITFCYSGAWFNYHITNSGAFEKLLL